MSRKRYLPSINSSDDESISEDGEYVPTDREISSESNSDTSEESVNSDESEEENARSKSKQSRVQKSFPKREVQNTLRRTTRGSKTIIYKDYVR